MIIADDITQEELEVFLQEADEQLQLLDEDFLTLEKEGTTAELLQEIFRAAHTLKGSSAMLGYGEMSQVAHAMETVLDKLRNGTLSVNTRVIDALLHGIDTLKSLKQEIISGNNLVIDIESIVMELENVIDSPESPVTDNIGNHISKNDNIQNRLTSAQEKGFGIFNITLEIFPTSSWPAVRMFQVIQELSKIGEVINTVPSDTQIKDGNVDYVMSAILASGVDSESIRGRLESIQDLCNLEINVNNGQANQSIPVLNSEDRDKLDDISLPDIQKSTGQKFSNVSQTVRVDVELLDRFMNLIGEMVIDRNRIVQISKILHSKFKEDDTIEALSETSVRMGKLISELQENIYKSRMLPISTVFNTFPRMIRDLAQKVHKKVDFIIEGQETELDRTIIEKIRDPLIHLLRNSVDHGIESRELRMWSGKPEQGTIRLSACQEQNNIVITVEDDGGGIDVQSVRDVAVRRQFVTAEEALKMTDSEALDLIFCSGLSTAKKTTEVSGRGVGMDAVRANIESMAASINVDSELGKGTKFTIRLPLTLATIEGLLVSLGKEVFIIPMNSVIEVSRLQIEQIGTVMGQQVIRFRNDVLPLHSLNKAFSIERDGYENFEGSSVVVVKGGDKQMGIIVDSVIEPQETVVKSLGGYIGSVKGIAGATILGNGQVALIIDTATLLKGITN